MYFLNLNQAVITSRWIKSCPTLKTFGRNRNRNVFLLDRVTDGFHVDENDVSVAALQTLHELQVVADFEALDRLLLQAKRKNYWSYHHSTKLKVILITFKRSVFPLPLHSSHNTAVA